MVPIYLRAEPQPHPGPLRLEAEQALLNTHRVVAIPLNGFSGRLGVALQDGCESNVATPESGSPDLVFPDSVLRPARYWIRTRASVNAQGAERLRKAANKLDALSMRLSVGTGPAVSRYVFTPWSPPESCVMMLDLVTRDSTNQPIAVWLPEGVRLDYLELVPYAPPPVPAGVTAYSPPVLPPAGHPRLWMTSTTLPKIRDRLESSENAAAWTRVQKWALRPLRSDPTPNAEVRYDATLESTAVSKAFVHQMTGEPTPAIEAIRGMRDYLAAVSFGNMQDITREMGRAVYSAALVYDWCYDLMTPEDRDSFRRNMIRVAEQMEIGWPPFRQSIVNGHGDEAQLNRDLLSMAIAVYDEDPEPYRYCAYRILEELVPMRRFEYQSARHNQGSSYGPYRYGWDLHAAWLFRRMVGTPVFDPNIGTVYESWLYMRLPGGLELRDGDGFADGRPFHAGLTPLLNYAYTGDSLVKWDFLRQGGMKDDPLMILLLNDPDLAAKDRLAELPLTKDFGPVLGSMIARTGWNMETNSPDVIAEIKGGGYHFGNHQHADAGSFQIVHRGIYIGDLGQYHFYGTPYDVNFNKRSVAHSLVRVADPEEIFPGTTSNDGGIRNVRSFPTSVAEATGQVEFANGTLQSSSFGPDPVRPAYSYYSVDLTSAYSSKITRHIRSFCFLNFGDEKIPAVILIRDAIETRSPEFQKIWQVNTPDVVERRRDGVVLRNRDPSETGRIAIRMLRPSPDAYDLEVLGGHAALTVSGMMYPPPFPDRPDAMGSRIQFTARGKATNDVFLSVLIPGSADATTLPVELSETADGYVLTLVDRVVVFQKSGKLTSAPFEMEVPAGSSWSLLLTGLQAGTWSLLGGDGKEISVSVEAGKNTIYTVVPGGRVFLRPISRK